MDNTDLLIIETLKKNGRASMKQIAKKTGIPITTVHYRLKSMENKKAIRFTARADRKFLGRELMAYILVRVMPGVDHEKIFQEIMKPFFLMMHRQMNKNPELKSVDVNQKEAK